jgi:hypothetical protein
METFFNVLLDFCSDKYDFVDNFDNLDNLE